MRHTLITAHAGCMDTPQNSIESVLAGLDSGAEIIEVDVHVTKDGVPILSHDDIAKTPNGFIPIQELTYTEWNQLYDQQVIKLSDVLPLIKTEKRCINLDVKCHDAIYPMIRLVEKMNMRDDVLISGSQKERAAYIKKHYSKYQVFLDPSFELYVANKYVYEQFVRQTCQDVIDLSCCGINIYHQHCRDELIDYASSRFIPVSVWTVDELSDMTRFLNKGVQGITSNEVVTLIELRNKLGGLNND